MSRVYEEQAGPGLGPKSQEAYLFPVNELPGHSAGSAASLTRTLPSSVFC